MIKPPSKPIPSATIIVIRDTSNGIEVLMTERNSKMSFAAGALVFPGGKVDFDDERTNYNLNKIPEDNLIESRIAAIRELFEETGLLMAYNATGSKVDIKTHNRLITDFRAGKNIETEKFSNLINKEGLNLKLENLLYVGHWVTPELSPKRFDTRFFLALEPKGQALFHDGNEAITAEWITPKDVLKGEEMGDFGVMFPTKLNLMKLSGIRDCNEALKDQNWQPVIKVTPYIEQRDAERWLRIPRNSGYELSEVPESQIFEFAGLNKTGKEKKP